MSTHLLKFRVCSVCAKMYSVISRNPCAFSSGEETGMLLMMSRLAEPKMKSHITGIRNQTSYNFPSTFTSIDFSHLEKKSNANTNFRA